MDINTTESIENRFWSFFPEAQLKIDFDLSFFKAQIYEFRKDAYKKKKRQRTNDF